MACSGLVGITNLCIWDDTTILNAGICVVENADNEFIRNIYTAYDADKDYGGRTLNHGLLKLSVELSNHITFYLYCQKIDVFGDKGTVLLSPKENETV